MTPALEESEEMTTAGANNAMRNTQSVIRNALDKTCLHCGQEYKARVTWQKFCSEECRLNHHGLTLNEAKKIGGKRKKVG